MPPVGEAVALPSAPPLQLTLVPVAETVRAFGSDIITLELAVQDLLSVTVTV